MQTNTLVTEAIQEPKPFTGRFIGISHRIKQKKDQTARPTLVTIMEQDGAVQNFKLEAEQDELDFANSQCAVKWEPVKFDQDISALLAHQVIFRAATDEDALVERHESQCRYEIKKGKKDSPDTKTLIEVATDIPCAWVGIQQHDTVSMVLGGSGDYFAFALSRKLSKMNGTLMRIPSFKLKDLRGQGEKDNDAHLLATLVSQTRDEFYETQVRDQGIIRLRNEYRVWMDTMRARIGCEQRLFQRHIGLTFCTEDGHFPEGSITKEFEKRKANDAVFQALLAEEKSAEKNLERAVQDLDVWKNVFEPIRGIGPKIAARMITAIIDIRRFETSAKLVKFMGVHVLADGRFPRRRNGEVANWHPDGRQALFLFGDQLVRQRDTTEWGTYLIAQKEKFRQKHPNIEVNIESGKKRYTKGHIHKMAIWRTLTRFTIRLHKDWSKLEKSAKQAGSQE